MEEWKWQKVTQQRLVCGRHLNEPKEGDEISARTCFRIFHCLTVSATATRSSNHGNQLNSFHAITTAIDEAYSNARRYSFDRLK